MAIENTDNAGFAEAQSWKHPLGTKGSDGQEDHVVHCLRRQTVKRGKPRQLHANLEATWGGAGME
jgi:hypothetical protein